MTSDRAADAPSVGGGDRQLGCGLTLGELRTANLARAAEWNPGGKDLGGPFAACELAGEVGEAVEELGVAIDAMLAALGLVRAMGAICNAVKKAERARAGIAGGVDGKVDLGRELADVVICADLIAMRLGVDLGAAVIEKFNLTSGERGFATRLEVDRNAFGLAAGDLYRRQRDALLALLRRRDALTDVVSALGRVDASLSECDEFKACVAMENTLRSLSIDPEKFVVVDGVAAGGVA